ncbi:MAG: LicD family protein [Butyrivibrio sp.]|nr:LicD family protein [Butyrivibrio sp.]
MRQRDINDIDRVIAGYILSSDEADYKDIIKYDQRDEVRDALSGYRESTISWYDIKPDDNVLEVGAYFGALTGKLLDMAGHVTAVEFSDFHVRALRDRFKGRNNFDTYKSEIIEDDDENIDIDLPGNYDIIIFHDFQDDFACHIENDRIRLKKILDKYMSFLKEDGKALFILDNHFAEEYIPVPGRINSEADKLVWSWSYKDIVSFIEENGFNYKFYYLLPDYRYVCDVYTDEELPNSEKWAYLKHASINGHITGISIDEKMRLSNYISNGFFPFYARSYVVEITKGGTLSEIKSVHIDTIERLTDHPQAPVSFDISSMDRDDKLIDKVRAVQIELLRELKRVCDANGLTIILIYGTLLGAVRNGGMIPGDDDIDVALSRADYDKLMKLQDQFGEKYFMQTPWNDNAFFGGYSKFRNKETSCIYPQNWWVDCCEGIGIDIFPIDYLYEDEGRELSRRKKIRFYQRLLYAKAYGYFDRHKDMELLEWKSYKYMGKPFGREKLADKLYEYFTAAGIFGDETSSKEDSDKILENSEDNNSSNKKSKSKKSGRRVGICSHYMNKNFMILDHDEKVYKKLINVSFEGMTFKAPAKWREVLEKRYGGGFLVSMGWDENKWRHGYYSVDVPYQVQKPHFRNMTKPNTGGRPAVLFGDRFVFESYMKDNGKTAKPVLMVEMPDMWASLGRQNLEAKKKEDDGEDSSFKISDKLYKDIKVISWDDFQKESVPDMYPVIASMDMHGTEEILRSAGMEEYYFYIVDRTWLHKANPASIYNEYYR